MSDSILQVDKIIDKAATSNKELATYASGNWSWGSGVPAGTVLQVVHGALATNFSTTTNGSWVDVNQKATITPSATSSKIFIIFSLLLITMLQAEEEEIYLKAISDQIQVITKG